MKRNLLKSSKNVLDWFLKDSRTLLLSLLKIMTDNALVGDDKIECLIALFNECSPWQDDKIFEDYRTKMEVTDLEEMLPLMDELLASLKAFGRDPEGMNRTEIGEELTMEDIYFASDDSRKRSERIWPEVQGLLSGFEKLPTSTRVSFITDMVYINIAAEYASEHLKKVVAALEKIEDHVRENYY